MKEEFLGEDTESASVPVHLPQCNVSSFVTKTLWQMRRLRIPCSYENNESPRDRSLIAPTHFAHGVREWETADWHLLRSSLAMSFVRNKWISAVGPIASFLCDTNKFSNRRSNNGCKHIEYNTKSNYSNYLFKLYIWLSAEYFLSYSFETTYFFKRTSQDFWLREFICEYLVLTRRFESFDFYSYHLFN